MSLSLAVSCSGALRAPFSRRSQTAATESVISRLVEFGLRTLATKTNIEPARWPSASPESPRCQSSLSAPVVGRAFAIHARPCAFGHRRSGFVNRIAAMKKDWKTWSLFQSQDVRDICAHMTAAEKAEASRRGGFYGLWVAVTFAFPLSLAIVEMSQLLVVIAAVLVVVHISCIPIWHKMQRRFLCSTSWARERGITPDRLRMFAFRSR